MVHNSIPETEHFALLVESLHLAYQDEISRVDPFYATHACLIDLSFPTLEEARTTYQTYQQSCEAIDARAIQDEVDNLVNEGVILRISLYEADGRELVQLLQEQLIHHSCRVATDFTLRVTKPFPTSAFFEAA